MDLLPITNIKISVRYIHYTCSLIIISYLDKEVKAFKIIYQCLLIITNIGTFTRWKILSTFTQYYIIYRMSQTDQFDIFKIFQFFYLNK